jgi:hypothetical protein
MRQVQSPMKLSLFGFAVLLGVSVLWVLTGTEREKPLLGARVSPALAALEANAAAHPNDPGPTVDLAQAYLDARQPGLATVLVEAASAVVRADLRVQHVGARALLDEGKNAAALAAERSVLAGCASATAAGSPRCDDVLVASARRRIAILEQMVAFGVSDVQAQPEMSFVAYKSATRETRISLE